MLIKSSCLDCGIDLLGFDMILLDISRMDMHMWLDCLEGAYRKKRHKNVILSRRKIGHKNVIRVHEK